MDFKKIVIGLASLAYFSLATPVFGVENNLYSQFCSGDIIAHTSKSRQSMFIRSITDSDYTHIGLIVKKNEKYLVLEAVQPVKYTLLENWIARGKEGKFSVKRLKGERDLSAVISEGEKFLGKNYDSSFFPDDREIYCSELVDKAYMRGIDVKLGDWESFSDIIGLKRFIPQYFREIRRRWGSFPADVKMVSPSSIMKSDKLFDVYSNY